MIEHGAFLAANLAHAQNRIGLNVLVDQSAEQLTARALTTPLLVGAKGSPLELVLSSLYFDADAPALSRFGDVSRVRETGLAEPIPLASIKEDAVLAEMPLVRQSRLSVMPVTAAQFRRALKLGRTKV